MLALVRAHHAGQADLATFGGIVKATMRDLRPDQHFAWTARHDPRGTLCSIGQLIVDAHHRAVKGKATYDAAANARSVIANIAALNGSLAKIGLPPMEATVAPGRATASVKVEGRMLTDFPLVLRDWDSVANSRLASSVKAESGYKAKWKCHRCGHTWEAEVAQRTVRQTRCQRCSTERADGLNALAVVRPDLVREWDTTAHAPLRPEKIKSTNDKTVRWICPDDPEHPAYRMSPFTRAKLPVGCPLCRRKARAQERLAA